MINFKDAIRTTVLLVDDDKRQLELRAITMKMSGFSVVTAIGPREAISIMNDPSSRRVDVAVIDYHMPVMNGCILSEYLKTRYPELKVILCSGAIDISEAEMSSVDAFVSKSEGPCGLLAKMAEVRQTEAEKSPIFMVENNAEAQVAN
jgi:DNA-binding NtrC family response regulator